MTGVGIGVVVVVGVLLSKVSPVSSTRTTAMQSGGVTEVLEMQSDGIYGTLELLGLQLPAVAERWYSSFMFDMDPVAIGTGELRHQETDLEVPSLGMPFRFTRVYRSSLGYNGPIGQGWDFNYNSHLIVVPTESTVTDVWVYDGTGRADLFDNKQDGNVFFPNAVTNFEKLLDVATNAHASVTTIKRELASPRLTYCYSNFHDSSNLDHYRLVSIMNKFGHEITFEYSMSSPYRLTTITDTEGAEYTLEYNTNGYVKKLTDFTGRTIEYEYEASTGRLTAVVELSGVTGQNRTTKYTYTTAGQLDTVTSPEQVALGGSGAPYLDNTYADDGSGRIVSQISGNGEYELTYPTSGNTPVTLTDRNGDQRVYHFDTLGRTTKIVVHDGASTFTTEYTYHTDGQIHEIKYPVIPGTSNRRIEKFTYDTNADPIRKARLTERRLCPATDSNGEDDLVWTYSSFDSTFNIPLSSSDPNGLQSATTITGTEPAYTFATTVGPSAGTQATTKSTYDSDGRLEIIENAEGDKTKYIYVPPASGMLPTGRVLRIEAEINSSYKTLQSFTYDSYRNTKTQTDSRGKTTTYNHNVRNNLTSIVYPGSAYTMTMEYDKDDRLVKRWVPVEGSTTRLECIARDIMGNPTSVTVDIDGTNDAVTTTVYDDGERVEKVTDPDGRTVEYVWNDRDLIKEIKYAVGTADAATEAFTYDHEGRVTTFTDGRSKLWKTEYDGHGRVKKRIDADGHYVEYFYGTGDHTSSADGTIVEHTKRFASGGTDPIRWTKLEYDDLFRTEKKHELAKLAPGGTDIGDGWQTTTYEYDLVGRTTKILDDRSTYIEFAYDEIGRLCVREHETGNQIEFDYEDQTSLVSKRTLTEKVGSTTKVTDREFSYDDLGRPVLQTDENNKPSTITYNFAGQVLTHKDQLANQVLHSYDRRGKRTQTVVKEANNTTVQTVSFKYYASGLLEKATDGAGKVTEYSYDNRGRLKEREYDPDSTKHTWTYDDANNVATMTDPRGTVLTYSYNDRGLLKTIAISGSSSPLGDTGNVTYNYNAVGETTKVCDGDSIVVLNRNTLGQIKSEKQIISSQAIAGSEWGRTIASVYDDAGRRTQVTYPYTGSSPLSSDYVLNYQYDDLYRLTALERSGSTMAAYTYAGFDRMTEASYSNGTDMLVTHDDRGLVTDVVHQDSNYTLFEVNRLVDPAGRTTWRQVQYNDSSNGNNYYSDVARYYYDAAGRMHCAFHGVTAPAWGGGGFTWSSDPTAAASKKIYTFTGADTRDSVLAIYYPGTVVTLSEPYSDNSSTHDYVSATIDGLSHAMGYDASGNRTSHDIGSTTADYGYDAFNRLVFATTASGGSVTTVTWRHDGLGRTIEEQVANSSGTTITRYYHDGNSRVLEVTVPSEAAYDEEAKVRTYVYGAEGPAPFFGRKEGTTAVEAFFHADERGSVMGLTSGSSSSILEHHRYQKSVSGLDEGRDYGEFTLHAGVSSTAASSMSAVAFGNSFLWTGSPVSRGLFDAAGQRLLLVEHGAAYDPVTGVGMQRGPGDGSFGGGAHSLPTATPADHGAGARGALGGSAGWGSQGGASRPWRRSEDLGSVSRRGGGLPELTLLFGSYYVGGGSHSWWEKGFGHITFQAQAREIQWQLAVPAALAKFLTELSKLSGVPVPVIKAAMNGNWLAVAQALGWTLKLPPVKSLWGLGASAVSIAQQISTAWNLVAAHIAKAGKMTVLQARVLMGSAQIVHAYKKEIGGYLFAFLVTGQVQVVEKIVGGHPASARWEKGTKGAIVAGEKVQIAAKTLEKGVKALLGEGNDKGAALYSELVTNASHLYHEMLHLKYHDKSHIDTGPKEEEFLRTMQFLINRRSNRLKDKLNAQGKEPTEDRGFNGLALAMQRIEKLLRRTW